MAKKIDLTVIDQMYSAQMSMNESEATLKTLRPQVEEAVKELIRQMGLPRDFKGVIPYHGFQIRVQRRTSYTWERNTNSAVTDDPNHAIYLRQLELQEQMSNQLKDIRADVKRTAEKLATNHPDSVSIKHTLIVAVMK